MIKNKQSLAPMANAANDISHAMPQPSDTPTRAPRRMAREPMASSGSASTEPEPESSTPGSKIAQVLVLLRRPHGATLAEMVEATGWQPHSTRAVLTGLRKKGHALVRGKRGDATCYTLGGAA